MGSKRGTLSWQIAEDRRRQQRDLHKAIVLARYGTSCTCCGTTANLQVDHIHGNGAQHRREVRGDMYLWLIRNGLPDGYQTLCQPCNTSKANGPACRIHQAIFDAWTARLNRDLTIRTDIPDTPR